MKIKYSTILKQLMIIILIMQFVGFSTTNVNAQVNNNEIEEKLSCLATLEDNFSDNRVLVALKTEVSKGLKSYSKEDFSEVSCVSVKSLTDYDAKRKQQELEKRVNNSSTSDFKTTLLLELAEKNKENVLKTIKKLEKREDVLYAEPDYIMNFFAVPNPTPTYYANQWALNNSNPNNPFLQMHNTWDITKGNEAIKVAIMDSGINVNHEDLEGKVDIASSRDFTLQSPYIPTSITDDDNHGTGVAGIVAAQGKGVIGVAPKVTLVSLKIANPDSNGQGNNKEAFISTAMLAFDYCAEEGFDVINLSAGYYGTPSSFLKSKIEQCEGLVVCAVGNESENNDATSAPVYPACFDSPNIISVGATNNSDSLCAFSDYGSNSVNIFAPGEDIFLTTNNGKYISDSGTSFAAPHVAGVAALIKSVNKDLSSSQIKSIITNSGDSITISTPSGNQNVKRLNAFKAVQNALPYSVSILNGNATITGLKQGSTISGSVLIPENIAVNNVIYPVTSIGGGAFANQTQLSQITIPASTTSINPNAFENCTNLASVTLPNNLISIGSEAFKGCTNLNNLIIPSSVVSISSNAFDNCTSLNNIVREFKYNINVANCYYFIKENLNNELIKVDGNTIVATSVIVPLYFNIGEHIIEIKTDNISSAIDTPIFEATSQLLLNSNQDIRSSIQNKKNVFYFNNHATRFVTFTLEASSSGTINYSANSIVVRDLNGVIQKFTIDGISNEAKNVNGSNTVTVYLPDIKKYYVEVNFDVTAEISELKLTARLLDNPSQVNLFDLDEDVKSSIDLFNNTTSKGDEIKAINILQSGKFEFKTDSTDQTANPIFVIMKKEVVNNQTVIEFFDAWEMDDYTKEVYLESGIYYVGYFNIVVGTNITIQIFRLVNQSGSHVLVTDPDVWTPSGSQISIIEADKSIKSYRQTFITEGFTRLIYPDFNYGVSASRLDYDWYSSNTNVATVTPYGTVLALPVTTDTTVKIMAVLKVNPSKVFVKEFTVLNDTETYSSAPIDIFVETTISASQHIYASSFFAGITVPIVILQYYSWSSSNTSYASVDGWGIIYAYQSAVGETVVITGNYLYNSRVKITMLFLITY